MEKTREIEQYLKWRFKLKVLEFAKDYGKVKGPVKYFHGTGVVWLGSHYTISVVVIKFKYQFLVSIATYGKFQFFKNDLTTTLNNGIGGIWQTSIAGWSS